VRTTEDPVSLRPFPSSHRAEAYWRVKLIVTIHVGRLSNEGSETLYRPLSKESGLVNGSANSY
jgi:hypothetical protein